MPGVQALPPAQDRPARSAGQIPPRRKRSHPACALGRRAARPCSSGSPARGRARGEGRRRRARTVFPRRSPSRARSHPCAARAAGHERRRDPRDSGGLARAQARPCARPRARRRGCAAFHPRRCPRAPSPRSAAPPSSRPPPASCGSRASCQGLRLPRRGISELLRRSYGLRCPCWSRTTSRSRRGGRASALRASSASGTTRPTHVEGGARFHTRFPFRAPAARPAACAEDPRDA